MRATQLFGGRGVTRGQVHLIGVPIRCRCIAPASTELPSHPANKVVKVNGLLIEDVEVIRVLRCLDGGRLAQVEFEGTIAIFGANFQAALTAVRQVDIEFLGGPVKGPARDLQVEVVGEVIMMGGKTFGLIGADR